MTLDDRTADDRTADDRTAADRTAGAADSWDVWLPFVPAEIDGLPAGPRYLHWDGEEEFPDDPARCAFYVLPYMKAPEVPLRPLPLMRSLAVVQTLTAGTDHVLPVISGLPAGVKLCNARGVHDASTAELALALILASLRGLPDFVRAQDETRWRSGFRPALADRTVLIVGYGSIGAAIEERLLPFEVARVLRVARTARTAYAPGAEQAGPLAEPEQPEPPEQPGRPERRVVRGPIHALQDLPDLLPQADVVVLATPLTDATQGLAGADFLSRMKDGALLVNIARGGVVDTKALLAETETGRLSAALDVTDPEPLPFGHPLWRTAGVLITPHVGGPTSAFRPRAESLLRDQLRRYVSGRPLRHVVAESGGSGPVG